MIFFDGLLYESHNRAKLMDLGLDYARYLHFDGSNELLLELSRGATKYDFVEYERTCLLYTSSR